MSGFAVIGQQPDGKVDRSVLERMSQCLAVRGPDEQGMRVLPGIGLVHAMLRTTHESQIETQPVSLDGNVWIVADARIDARDELVTKLRAHRRDASLRDPDVLLILHAYHIWGQACVDHLLGDFSFVVADAKANRVFGARDQLGVKSLFYAMGEGWIALSNSLDCVRLHPTVSETLHEPFILDFLLFGWNTDVAGTVFADIHRLVPGHCFEWSPQDFRSWRYWIPRVPSDIRLRRPEDYVSAFREVFDKAVADRLRTDRVAFTFSGGMDSTSVAATALGIGRRKVSPPSFQAVSVVYDRVMPDRERFFATMAADKLELPLDFVVADDLPIFDQYWDSPATQTPEPSQRGGSAGRKMMELVASSARVLFHGEGGDEALRTVPQYYFKLLRDFRFLRFALDCCRHVGTLQSLPPVGVRTLLYKGAWNRITKGRTPQPELPKWINPDLANKCDALDRWHHFWNSSNQVHSSIPRGFVVLNSYLGSCALNWHEVTAAQVQMENCFPFFDLRVLEFCWSVPPTPMRFEKYLLRQAMQGQLPEAVLRRRKQGLVGDPLLAKDWELPLSWQECLQRTPEIHRFVTGTPPSNGKDASRNTYVVWDNTRPFELASWLFHRWGDEQVGAPISG